MGSASVAGLSSQCSEAVATAQQCRRTKG